MAVYLKTRNLSKGRKRYYLHIYQDGQHEYENLFTVEKGDDKREKKKLAETIRAQKALELESKGTGYTPKHKRKILLNTYLDHYLSEYKKRDIRIMTATISRFKEFIANDKQTLSTLTEKQMEGFKHYLLHESGLNGETPYNYWNRLKKVLKQAHRERYIDDAIYKYIRWEKTKSNETLTKQILTEEEIQLLKNTACGNDEVKRAFLFACYTGIGYAEAKNLDWQQIQDGRLQYYREKSEKEVNLKLAQAAIDLIGTADQGLIFDFHRNGKKISNTAINKNIKNWIAKAGIEKHITFYCARHSFAIRLLNAGANLKTVADAMGHSSTKQTVKYLSYTDKQKDSVTSNLA